MPSKHIIGSLSIALLVAFLAPVSAGQTAWLVDDDAPGDPAPGDPTVSDPLEDGSTLHPFDAIQDALNAAAAGDVVLVMDGLYTGAGNNNLDFGGVDLTVRGDCGPENCVIDCDDAQYGFYLHRGETIAATLDGLTIRHAQHAVYIRQAAATLRNCIIEECSADSGPGLYCVTATVNAFACVFANNTASERGGAIYCASSTFNLINSLVTGNSNSDAYIYEGGGIYLGNCDTNLINSLIVNNFCSSDWRGYGGGVFFDGGGSLDVSSCTIVRNRANNGAALYAHPDCSTNVTISNSILWHSDFETTCSIINCRDGMLSYCTLPGGKFMLPGCRRAGPGLIDAEPLFVDPDGPDDDASTWRDNDWRLVAGSCIDRGRNDLLPLDQFDLDGDGDVAEILPVDYAGADRLIDAHRIIHPDAPDAAAVDLGALEAVADAPYICLSDTRRLLNHIENDPNDLSVELKLSNAGAGDASWTITSDSQWINATPSSGVLSDEDVTVQLSIDHADLNYGKYNANLTLTSPDAAATNIQIRVKLLINRLFRVPSEYAAIQDAIDAANRTGDVVLIADGVYAGEGNTTLTNRGKRITIRSENGPENCIIDCEHNYRGISLSSVSDARLEGLTIRNAHHNLHAIRCYGQPTIVDCVITGIQNEDFYEESAITCDGSPTFLRCRVYDNDAYALEARANDYYSHPLIQECELVDNKFGVGFSGGGTPLIKNSIIADNDYAGIIGNEIYTPLYLDGCLIVGNGWMASSDYGCGLRCHVQGAFINNCNVLGNRAAGLMISSSSEEPAEITNCLMANNGGPALSKLGSIYVANCTMVDNGWNPYIAGCGAIVDDPLCRDEFDLTISNCIMRNYPECELYNNSHETRSVTYCNIRGGFDGVGNFDADPLFIDPDGPDDDPNAWADNDYRLAPTSPCLDAGDNAAVLPDLFDLDRDENTLEPNPFDLAGNPRFIDVPYLPDVGAGDPPIVDIGAYEYTPGDVDGDGDVDLGDLANLLARYGQCDGAPNYSPAADFDADGCVNLSDLALILACYGTIP